MKHFYTDWEEFKSGRMCNAWVATAVIGAGAVGAAATAWGASKASDAQKYAADSARDTALGMYNTTRTDLEPFRQIGIDANTDLQKRLPFLTSPITMDQDTLEKTPGYQFTKTQGLKAVQNSAAKRGLGVSGAALKGAASFATGLADQTYQTQFNLENINRSNTFNRLKSLVDTGESAAAKTGAAGTAAANTAAGAIIGGGNAQAAGANAIGGAVKGFANDVAGYSYYRGLYGGSPSVSPSGPTGAVDPTQGF